MSSKQGHSPTATPGRAKTAAGQRRTLLTADDLYLFNEGNHFRLHEKLGAHAVSFDGTRGVTFAIWAPNAEHVSVIGDFNGWRKGENALQPLGDSGIWDAFIPGVEAGAKYKYHVESHMAGYRVDKADPLGFYCEPPPRTASIVWDLEYSWGDVEWMRNRAARNALSAPIAVYEVHLGSWMRCPEQGGRSLTYREITPKLVEYVRKMGFTHVELLPVMEHPFYGSWGYQTTGYFAPTCRYGTPQDFMALVDELHQSEIGVILDWVPSHFPCDEHGLAFLDGTHLYEHADPRLGIQPDWNSYVFNYGRHEVRSFLISNALFWLDKYHADGLRVDAVASTLYLDYSRKAGEWVPNRFGGRENLDAVAFLQRLNETVYAACPDVQMIAEESTAWPMVSRPIYLGGLGFGLKWDMGWMHDTLTYMAHDPIHRRFHHNLLTFRGVYAFTENFMLPLSHDEVVHGKDSLLSKMPGDHWRKFANLRLLLGYMYTQPGKKLLFMGGEFGQWREWSHEDSLDWHLLAEEPHRRLQRWVEDLNRIYRREEALHVLDLQEAGFEWIDCNDSEASVLSYLRKAAPAGPALLVICNFTPMPRFNYRIGAPAGGFWSEILNSDSREYGGSNVGNFGKVEASPLPAHGRPFSLTLALPPLGMLVLKPTS